MTDITALIAKLEERQRTWSAALAAGRPVGVALDADELEILIAALLKATEAREAALREALERTVVVMANLYSRGKQGRGHMCKLCDGEGRRIDSVQHKPDCLLTTPRPGAEEAAKGNWISKVFKPLPESEAKLLRDYGPGDPDD